ADGEGFLHVDAGSARRARLHDAFRYVFSVAGERGTIDVVVRARRPSDIPYLARASTSAYYVRNIQNGLVYARLRLGYKPVASDPELQLQVDFNHLWNTSTWAPAPDQFDLLSVLIASCTHGLGIFSSLNENSMSFSTTDIYMH